MARPTSSRTASTASWCRMATLRRWRHRSRSRCRIAARPGPDARAGYQRALDFSDEHVMELWAALMAEIAAKRRGSETRVLTSELELPPARSTPLTVNIPENYGGMTASMLQRSRAFVKHAGKPKSRSSRTSTITDLDTMRARLRERGAIVDGITVAQRVGRRYASGTTPRCAGPAHRSSARLPDDFEPLGDRGDVVDPRKRRAARRLRSRLQIDYLRDDGTVLLSDQAAEPGQAGASAALCDTAGKPIGAWSRHVPVRTRSGSTRSRATRWHGSSSSRSPAPT